MQEETLKSFMERWKLRASSNVPCLLVYPINTECRVQAHQLKDYTVKSYVSGGGLVMVPRKV